MQDADTIAEHSSGLGAKGVKIVSVFGLIWFLVGSVTLKVVMIPAVIIGIILFIMVLRSASKAVARAKVNDLPVGSVNRLRSVIAIEAILIAFCVVTGNALKHQEIIPPLIMLVVGLHFLAFKRVFSDGRYTRLGFLMTIVALIICFVALLGLLSKGSIQSVAGFASALLLWDAALRTKV